jgi:hypothetical protein
VRLVSTVAGHRRFLPLPPAGFPSAYLPILTISLARQGAFVAAARFYNSPPRATLVRSVSSDSEKDGQGRDGKSKGKGRRRGEEGAGKAGGKPGREGKERWDGRPPTWLATSKDPEALVRFIDEVPARPPCHPVFSVALFTVFSYTAYALFGLCLFSSRILHPLIDSLPLFFFSVSSTGRD